SFVYQAGLHFDEDPFVAPTFSLVDNDGGRFWIDPNTGTVTVADTIDRESHPEGHFKVQAVVDAGLPSEITLAQTVTVAIGDLNDNSPTFLNADDLYITENNLTGQTVGLIQGYDADLNTLTYSLQYDHSSGVSF